jgi:hypothetical protein
MNTDLNLLNCHSFNLPVIPEGIYYGQYENLDAINRGILDRINTDTPLRPNLDFRSVPTRATLYPTIDNRPKYKGKYLDYSVERTFAPVHAKGPVQGFNVDDETRLKNQYFALQHGAEQSIYVPSSTSDLYKVNVPTTSHAYSQPFPELFTRHQYMTAPAPMADRIGTDMFNNCTQTQLRNTVKM